LAQRSIQPSRGEAVGAAPKRPSSKANGGTRQTGWVNIEWVDIESVDIEWVDTERAHIKRVNVELVGVELAGVELVRVEAVRVEAVRKGADYQRVGSQGIESGQKPTRRSFVRRRIALLFSVAALAITGMGVASASGSSGGPSTHVHIVMPGESLWSIARGVKPEGDVRPLVAKLRHQLLNATLMPGDELVVPTTTNR
jgi:hypothetical protein